MALYDDLNGIDLISPLGNQYKVRYTKEGRPVVLLESVYVPTPWINHRIVSDRRCAVWTVYFNLYGIIPQGCRQCWKVVMRVETLAEAMELEVKQREEKYNCKVGLETRPITGGLGGYRAFWYGPLDGGLAGGREMFKDLSYRFPDKDLILKRGCTEFEARYHPSDEWDRMAQDFGWDRKETLINSLFLSQKLSDGSTKAVFRPSIFKRWIEWGYEHHKTTGDHSCFDYLSGPPMPDYMTYHSSTHKDADYDAKLYPIPNETDGYIQEALVPERSGVDEDEDRSSGSENVFIASI